MNVNAFDQTPNSFEAYSNARIFMGISVLMLFLLVNAGDYFLWLDFHSRKRVHDERGGRKKNIK